MILLKGRKSCGGTHGRTEEPCALALHLELLVYSPSSHLSFSPNHISPFFSTATSSPIQSSTYESCSLFAGGASFHHSPSRSSLEASTVPPTHSTLCSAQADTLSRSASDHSIIGAGGISTTFAADLLLDPTACVSASARCRAGVLTCSSATLRRGETGVQHKVVAVAARSLTKAQGFIKDVLKGDTEAQPYGSYDELIADTVRPAADRPSPQSFLLT